MGSEGSSTSPSGSAAACAVCSGSAALYCPADAAALCAPCDAAIHSANPLASRHERLPLAIAMVATSGVYDLFAADDEGGLAASSWPGKASPNISSSSFSNCSGNETSLFHILSDVDLMAAGATGGSLCLSDGVSIHGAAAPLCLQPVLAVDASTWSSPFESALVVTAAADRQERVRRYREKRKNRKFQKTIRYATRKAYAEARPRIKGRFVKRAASSDDDSTGAAADGAKFWLSFSDDSLVYDAAAYGVVPTF